ncbi:pseudouridine synthase [Tahibacter harae]|uniref:Pseudouridine synthase n=1 Tax=Tahibacter harae TaxID=2963937 RepID=A0ABT1QR88_9GAMM|nr:pseudouridine synthase [Tahibacter harae]MCQ4164818.1 rRNA pseudouridine synthase [Tahibacter harae]
MPAFPPSRRHGAAKKTAAGAARKSAAGATKKPAVAGAAGKSAPSAGATRHGLARVISKRGYCSRSQAEVLVRAGRVSLNGRLVRDPETPARLDADRISVDGHDIAAAASVWIMLNKPRGLVTTTRDEQGRDTVYALLDDASLPWLAPVGRLDKASEGLLLFSNDSAAAARLAAPESEIRKTYHVQIDCVPAAALLDQLRAGVREGGELLAAKSVQLLRSGGKNAWLEIVLDEGRNRHIRRLLAAHGIGVLRLVRVAIGPLALGELAKGQWRRLGADEIAALVSTAG